ncbi:Gfo/Idh/MocA family oxidoreductase, partial [Planktomarina temperata]|nr:Gfo/Idh/MocA family oxidoreductase [Planktomarina temperata]
MIHVAILGAGIGREHLAAFRALKDRFTVRAVVDQDLARVEDIRQDGDSFRALKDIDQALADPQVQVVDICLPPHLHASVTQRALAAGKHVICEKPLATSLADVDEIRRAAQAADRKVYPVFQYRWGPSLAQLRHLMTCGLTGQLQVAALETHWSRGADYYAVPWRG